MTGLLDIGSALFKQEELERECVEAGRTRWWERHEAVVRSGRGHTMPSVQRWLSFWYPEFESLIRRRRAALKRDGYDLAGAIIQPFVSKTPSSVLANLALVTLGNSLMSVEKTAGVRVTHTCIEVGKAVVAWCCYRHNCQDHIHVFEHMRRRNILNPKQVLKWAKVHGTTWGETRTCLSLGAWLLDSLLQTAAAAEYGPDKPWIPAFRYENRPIGNKKLAKFFVMDPDVYEAISEDNSFIARRSPRLLPMIYPPHLWTDTDPGGYIRIRKPLIKTHTPLHRETVYSQSDLAPLRRCINSLNRVPLMVNERVAGVVEEIMKKGGGVCGLPTTTPIKAPPKLHKDVTDDALVKQQKRQVYHWRNEESARKAMVHEVQRVSFAADQFKDQTFFLPHFADFRGRMYPVPSILHHHSIDWQNAMIEFGNEHEPDEWGQAIHTANMFGLDKAPFSQRHGWVRHNMDSIQRSASDPMGNIDFWGEADKPFAFLACCFAWTDDTAARRLPCQRDGTCNGLQHLAALTRDADAARLVNLRPGDTPQDIYSTVAEAARGLMEFAIADGNQRAKWSVKYIGDKWRKCFKPRVMTDVYGVTPVGARKQFAEFMVSQGCDADPYTCNKERRCDKCMFCVSSYLVGVSGDAIDAVYGQSRAALDWFKECAAVLLDQNAFISWTNPTGVRVMQHYGAEQLRRVQTPFGRLAIYRDLVTPDRDDHMRGIAPNAVHSIDAAHMNKYVLACDDDGIDVMAKHDAYITHSAHFERSGHHIRHTFAELHQDRWLQRFLDEWRSQYPGVDLPDPPTDGLWDVNEVLNAQYAF